MSSMPNGPGEPAFIFGPFRLQPAKKLLLEGETPVRIGSRALEILTVLVEQAGILVSRTELMERAWPKTVVEESNLKVTVASLRKALGEGQLDRRFIVNVPGRGYQFVAPVHCVDASDVLRLAHASSTGLPASPTRVFGRAEVVSMLARLLPERRFISIVGPGGIGKTTTACAVAAAVAENFEHGVHFVDLAPLLDAQFVAMAVAKALGVTIHSEDTVAALVLALRDRRALVVLDNCEHVLQATAVLIEQVLAGAPGVLVLTTTREPLRARAEMVHRLAPLPTPPSSTDLSASQALGFSAVELFVERASACRAGYEFSDADAPVVADICRKLGGIALAIELTATRFDAFTLRELSTLLDDRFRLLSMDRRGASQRHSSLAATLDWSHELLLEEERRVLRRLSMFAGLFTLLSAISVVGNDCDVVAALEGLVSKSLVSADVAGAEVQYRLLDTVRAYAAQKLHDSGEVANLQRRHAVFYLEALLRAERESHIRTSVDWVAAHAQWLDDVRAALAWAFSNGGDVELGTALTIAAIPLWTQLSLLDECRVSLERALTADSPRSSLLRSDRMKMSAALGTALLYTRGPGPETGLYLKDALGIAEQAEDIPYQLKTLWSLSVYLIFTGDYRAAFAYLRRFRVLARRHGDRTDRLSADRLIAMTLHYFGRQPSARKRLELIQDAYSSLGKQALITRFQFDQRGAARGTLAHVLWLQGAADQAEHMARLAVEDAHAAAGHPISMCNALGHVAFQIALHRGDLVAAESYLNRLHSFLDHNALALWRSLGAGFSGVLKIQRGQRDGLDQVRDAVEELRYAGYRSRQSYFLCALARGQLEAGQIAEARATIESLLSACNQTGEMWFLAEAIRIKGQIVRVEATSTAPRVAEQLYRQAMLVAREQGALAWELRAAMSLAELCLDRRRDDGCSELLDALIGRFTEGFGTSDLRYAGQLASHLRSSQSVQKGGKAIHLASPRLTAIRT